MKIISVCKSPLKIGKVVVYQNELTEVDQNDFNRFKLTTAGKLYCEKFITVESQSVVEKVKDKIKKNKKVDESGVDTKEILEKL